MIWLTKEKMAISLEFINPKLPNAIVYHLTKLTIKVESIWLLLCLIEDSTCEPELVCVPIGDFPVLGAIWYPKQYEISLQAKQKRVRELEN